VADLAPAGPLMRPGLTDGIIREIIVEDEFLFADTAGVGVEFLGVLAGAECGEGDGLGFAAAEQRGPVGARGNRPTSQEIGRTWSRLRASRRLPSFRISPRTASFSM